MPMQRQGKGNWADMPEVVSRESSWPGSADCRHRADQHRVTGTLPAFWQKGWTCLRRLTHSPSFSSPGYGGLMCSARLAFPGKRTQEPQCGRRSSYEVDSRLTGSFFLFFCFVSQNDCLNPAENLFAVSATQKQLDPPNTSLFSRAT